MRGAAAISELLDQRADSAVYEALDERYHPIDAERVVIEGRMRWMDETRTLRDGPAIWAVEFRDGLLYRSFTARSRAEAEAALVASRAQDG